MCKYARSTRSSKEPQEYALMTYDFEISEPYKHYNVDTVTKKYYKTFNTFHIEIQYLKYINMNVNKKMNL